MGTSYEIMRFSVRKDDLIIFSRRDFFLWLRGKADEQMNQFMKKYFPQWLFLNILDQSLHMISILLFVFVI